MPPKLRFIGKEKEVCLTLNPPQHKFENDPNHRSFLSRSLSRSDVELNALVKLNTSLNDMKEYIVEKFGMDCLLDIGEGLIEVQQRDYVVATDRGSICSSADGNEKEVLVFNHSLKNNQSKDDQNSNPDTNDDDGIKDETKSETASTKNDETKSETETENETKTGNQNTIPSHYMHLLQSDSTFSPIVKNFILSLKLRRKLLNRLSRRLLRLSHAMDGKLHKINPPMLPRYGTNFEHNTNSEEFKNKANKWNMEVEAREEVMEKLWKKKEELIKATMMIEDDEVDKAEDLKMEVDTKEDKIVEITGSNATAQEISSSTSVKIENTEDNNGDSQKDQEQSSSTENQTNNGNSDNIKNETQEMMMEREEMITKREEPRMKAEDVVVSSTAAVESSSSFFPSNPFVLDGEHQKDMEKLIQCDSDYDKKVTFHIPTSSIIKTTTALTKDDLDALDKNEDDFDENTNSMTSGIGAVSRYMTKKEKVIEWKRWQTEFLSKVPDQPTLKELGIENQVFFVEERRKLVRQKKRDDTMEIDDEENVENNENKNNDDKENVDDEKDSKKHIEHEMEPLLKRKRISLDPVPSYYQQDHSQILMIQSATLSAALSSTLRDTYNQAKTEYDQIFKRSQEFSSRKTLLESQLSRAMYDYRIKVNAINSTITVAKNKWDAEKKAFEERKYQMKQMEAQMTGQPLAPAVHDAMKMSDSAIVKRAISGAVDRVVIRSAPQQHASGSQTTLTQLQRFAKSTVEHEVATTMSHCLDTVVKRIATGHLTDSIVDQAKAGEQFPPFIPPASANPDHVIMNNGETFTTMKNRFEAEISRVKSQLDTSEAARAKAWSRLSKAQVAMNNRGMSTYVGRSTKSNRSNTSSTNVRPVQRYNQQQPQPRTIYATSTSVSMASNPAIASAAAAAAAVKANMTHDPSQVSQQVPKTPATPVYTSQSKYSIEKVRARMFADGSVLPVGSPKRGKDGLYLRPAGRQRKGMDWDGVNGKWVPEGSLMH